MSDTKSVRRVIQYGRERESEGQDLEIRWLVALDDRGLPLLELAVERFERLCIRHYPEPGAEPKRGSDGWHAREILRRIEDLRDLVDAGQMELAFTSAVSLGYFAGKWHEARELMERGRRGGQASKKRQKTLELVDRLVRAKPSAKPRQLWRLVPEWSEDDPEVYRGRDKEDNEVIFEIEIDPETTELLSKRKTAYRTFQRYVRYAKTRQ